MVQRAQREPTMEEIVVALRDARQSAGRQQSFPMTRPPRSNTNPGSADLSDLRDTEIERLLAENARLNARVISLLKVLELEQVHTAHIAAEAPETDRDAIYREVRTALEAELGPLLLLLLRMLQAQGTEPTTDEALEPSTATLPQAAPSEWIVELMHKLEGKAAVSHDPVTADQAAQRLPKLRQCVADILGAFGLESAAAPARRRFTPQDPA